MINLGNIYVDGKVPVGTKIKFRNEKKRYTVRASNICFLVCTYPINIIKRRGGKKYEHEKTVMYTIVDFKEGVRGTENLVFGFGAETNRECNEMLTRLTEGETEVSHRNRVPLDDRYGIESAILKKHD